MKALSCILALIIADFLYQWMQADPNWLVATERSFFQTIAIVVYAYLWPSP